MFCFCSLLTPIFTRAKINVLKGDEMNVLNNEQKLYFQGGTFTVRLSKDFYHNCITKDPFIHSHPYYEFHYVKEGSVILSVNGEKVEYLENTILIIPPTCPHKVTANRIDAKTYTFTFYPSENYIIDNVYSAICQNSILSFSDTIEAEKKLTHIREILINNQGVYVDIIRGELTLLFAELSSTVSKATKFQLEDKDENRAGKIQAYLVENYASPTCNCEELAKIMGLSKRQVHRLCISYFSLSFREMLHRMRMEIAKYRVELGKNSIAEISEQLGYSSPASFSSTYKRFYGRSPKKDI